MEMNEEVKAAIAGISDKKLKDAAEDLMERINATGEGMEDDVSFQIPYLRLVQAMTDPDTLPEGAARGDYVIGTADDGEKMPKPLEFYLVMVEDGRSYFEASTDDTKAPKLLCYSPDGVIGKMGICKECPLSKWEDGEKSACRKNRTIIGVTPDLDLVFKYVFSKTGYSEGMGITKKLRTIRGVSNTYDFLWALDSAPYPERKTVSVPVVTVASRTVEPTLKNFLKELTRQIKEDHKIYVQMFRESVEQNGTKVIAHEVDRDPDAPLNTGAQKELTFNLD